MNLPLPILKLILIAALAGSALTSCETIDPAIKQRRDAEIAAEPRGDFYIGRRFATFRCRFWGYLRRPGQPWDTAKLVIFNERSCKQPDRLPEVASSGNSHGYDHNYEYRIFGNYTGRTIYDPNADLMVPEFALARYELLSERPGFLFDPREVYDPRRLPSRETSGRGY